MLPVAEVDITEQDVNYVIASLKAKELSGRSRVVKEFEEAFAKYLGVKYCVAVPNGTIALHLALASLGVKQGDEVILPSSTISSCALAVLYCGATPVIVDVNPESWCLDKVAVAQAVTTKTKVIMPVHLYGLMSNLSSLRSIAKWGAGKQIHIVEDAAEAIGSKNKYGLSGTQGEIGCFSLYFNKVIHTGEGGTVVTNDRYLYERILAIGNLAFGKTKNDRFLTSELAFNYRFNGLGAALGLSQLKCIEKLINDRQIIHSYYRQYLSPRFIWQKEEEGDFNTYWMEAVLIPGNKGIEYRNGLIDFMTKNGVETRTAFPPLSIQPFLRNTNTIFYDDTNAKYIWENAIIFPSVGSQLTEDKIKEVCKLANKFLEVS